MTGLRAIRIAHNESQNALAKAIGISRVAIGHYETGRRKPDYLMLMRIAQHYGVTLDELVNGDKADKE